MQNVQSRSSVSRLAVLGLVGGIITALIAQFVLDSLADRGDFFHQLQHGLLFAGGLAVGASLLSLYRSGQQPA